MIDITGLAKSQEAGLAVIEKVSYEPAPIPVQTNNEQIKITIKRFDQYTGTEVDPAVQIIYKRGLINERVGLENQKKAADERIAAIDGLLENFT